MWFSIGRNPWALQLFSESSVFGIGEQSNGAWLEPKSLPTERNAVFLRYAFALSMSSLSLVRCLDVKRRCTRLWCWELKELTEDELEDEEEDTEFGDGSDEDDEEDMPDKATSISIGKWVLSESRLFPNGAESHMIETAVIMRYKKLWLWQGKKHKNENVMNWNEMMLKKSQHKMERMIK